MNPRRREKSPPNKNMNPTAPIHTQKTPLKAPFPQNSRKRRKSPFRNTSPKRPPLLKITTQSEATRRPPRRKMSRKRRMTPLPSFTRTIKTKAVWRPHPPRTRSRRISRTMTICMLKQGKAKKERSPLPSLPLFLLQSSLSA